MTNHADEAAELERQLLELRRLNQAQSEALLALRHMVVCWPPKNGEEAAMFDYSALQVAREVLETVRRVLKERDELTKVLRNVLWVARGATDSHLEDAFGHALSNIEMRVEEALGIGPEDVVEETP